jgi:hypothetical protein
MLRHRRGSAPVLITRFSMVMVEGAHHVNTETSGDFTSARKPTGKMGVFGKTPTGSPPGEV